MNPYEPPKEVGESKPIDLNKAAWVVAAVLVVIMVAIGLFIGLYLDFKQLR